MNQLFQHIEYLLLRHDCVIVPGLGAFMVSVTPAGIDWDNGVITPPRRKVSFNQSISADDGILANSVARKMQLSFADARSVIIRAVNAFKDSLTASPVDCGKLGTLSLNEDGNLIFMPSAESADAVNPGFEAIRFAPAAQSVAVPEPVEEPADEPANKGLKAFANWGKAAVACFAVCAIIVTILLNPIPRDKREQRASVVPVEAFIPKPTKVDVAKVEIKPDSIVAPVEETPVADPKYYLIVASFTSQREAENYADAQSTDEYPLMTVSSRKMCRVAVESSDDRQELQGKLNSITKKFPNAWIWSRI